MKSKVIKVGRIKIGGGNPLVIKGMIKSPLNNKAKVIKEAKGLEQEGCQIVRLAVEKEADADILSALKRELTVPIEADIHFNHRLALLSLKKGADCIRLNPLNIERSAHLREVVKAAKARGIPIRVGVNSGGFRGKSSDKALASAMAKKVLSYVRIIERFKFRKIMLSAKANSPKATILVNQMLKQKSSYPLHLGLTATGPFYEGLIKSSLTLGILISQGIGSAMRLSLNADSREEVRVAKHILQALGRKVYYPEIISCPTCSRCKVDLRGKVEDFRKILYQGRNSFYNKKVKVALMGCPVNGPGEASAADLGIAFGKDFGVLFKKGKPVRRINESQYKGVLLKALK
jgi:(E)-4-hydroxy-3-methylbut-2-enyl-diphosphate synthase